MNLNVELEQEMTRITSDEDQLQIEIYTGDKIPVIENSGIGIILFENMIKAIFLVEEKIDVKNEQWDKLILINTPTEIDYQYVRRGLINQAFNNKVKLPKTFKEEPIPANMQKLVNEFVQKHLFVINHFGTDHFLEKAPKKRPAKAQHRWNKTVSEIPFYVDTPDSKAEIQWIKRNEMVIRAGATMKKDMPLNKDGSIGFGAKMTEKVRDDHRDSFKDFKTTEDIVLKSVNEVSLFLYYAGTNSWLVFKDKDGKTIDEWTKV